MGSKVTKRKFPKSRNTFLRSETSWNFVFACHPVETEVYCLQEVMKIQVTKNTELTELKYIYIKTSYHLWTLDCLNSLNATYFIWKINTIMHDCHKVHNAWLSITNVFLFMNFLFFHFELYFLLTRKLLLSSDANCRSCKAWSLHRCRLHTMPLEHTAVPGAQVLDGLVHIGP